MQTRVDGCSPRVSRPRARVSSLAMLLASLLSLLLFTLGSGSVHAASPAGVQAGWSTFRDPIYGFSFNYPLAWTLIPGSDGSHITLLNTRTQTTLSPLVTTQVGSPESILKQALPASAVKPQTRTVAGQAAADYILPYLPASAKQASEADIALPQQIRQVVVPVANSSGATNVYTFLLTQPTNAAGQINAAEQADQQTFEAILSSVRLPAQATSAVSALSVSPMSISGCDRICWADANWSYTKYDDTATTYCDGAGYNGGYYSVTCVGTSYYGAQVPSGNGGYFQPNFQCADFVSRALTEDGMVPGLNNGGVGGLLPATNSIGSPSYQTYTASIGGASGNVYNLILASSLDHYLIDSGLGINIGTNVQAASAGDVVIYSNEEGEHHAMITTSAPFLNSSGRWDILIDGHNAAAYHNTLSSWIGGFVSYKIIHLGGVSSGSHNDFNGDGKSDVMGFYDLGASNGSNATGAYEWLGTSSGISSQGQIWNASGFTWSDATWLGGDFNGDGKADALAFYDLGTVNGSNVTGAYEWLGTSSGLSYKGQIWSANGFTWSAAKWVAGDFNGDGKADVMAFYDLGTVGGSNVTGAYEWLGTGSGLSYKGQIWSASGFTWSAATWIAGDFNGDGKADALALYNLGTDTTGAYEWLGTSSGLSYRGQVWSVVGFSWTKARWVAGDFNGDGNADIMGFYDMGASNGSNVTGAYEWLSTGGSFSLQGQIWSASGFTWSAATWVGGDFNGDGKADAMALYDLGLQSSGTYATGAYEWLGTSSGLSYKGQIWKSLSFTWSKCKWIS